MRRAGKRRRPLTVYYDADCAFCSECARLLHRLDGGRRLRLVPMLHASRERSDAPELEQLLETIHAVDGERWWTGGAAFVEIAARIPILRPLSLLARLPLVRGAIEPGYRLVAGNRHRIGQALGSKVCRIPQNSGSTE